MKNKGFTLIELLVVIAIFSLLSSVVLTNVNSARMKAIDARKQADFKSITLALNMFYDATGRMPLNYNPCCGAIDGSSFYTQSMLELVTDESLSSIPRSPGGGGGYAYYDYGPNNEIGTLIVTDLRSSPTTISGK